MSDIAWQQGHQIHPAAEAFPLIEGDEFDALVADIADKGLLHPIVLDPTGEYVVDGRNRLRACYEAQVDPTFRRLGSHYDEQEIVDYVVSANLRRRQMTLAERAFAADNLRPIYEAAARARQAVWSHEVDDNSLVERVPQVSHSGKTRDDVADLFDISGKTADAARDIRQHKPELEADVLAGKVSITKAGQQARAAKKAKAQPAAEPPPKPTPVTVDLVRPDGTTVPYPKPKVVKFNETKGDGISWAGWSWNPVTGCDHGCDYCYARDIALNSRYSDAYPVGFDPIFHPERLSATTNTKSGDGPAGRVFVCSMADLFGRWVPDEWIDQVLRACKAAPEWTYIFLTKFPKRYEGLTFPPNAWVGTSVDTQRRADLIGHSMSKVNASVRWLSIEPLLEPVKFDDLSMYEWVVIGAQTSTAGTPAVAPHFEWVADIVRTARRDGCKVHLKPNLRSAPGMVLPDEYPA